MSFGGAPANPFVAARFEPGALPWFGDEPDELGALASRVLVPGARFQILGPHGSGKSTLLVELGRRARAAGWSVWRRRGSSGLGELGRFGERGRPRLLLLDEYQELSPWEVLRLRLAGAWENAALVVTAHRDVGFSTLCERAVSAETARLVVERLLAGRETPAPELPVLAAALDRHRGNLREVLFELYDQVEHSHPPEGSLRSPGLSARPLMLGGRRGIEGSMSLPTVDLSQFGADRVRAAVQAAVEHASAGALPTAGVLKHGAEATLKSEDAEASTYFVSIIELAYLVASADGLAAAERNTLAALLERLTGKAVDHAALELHFKDLDDAVEMLGRRERLRRAAEDFADTTRQHEALGFAAVVALADGKLADPENAALAELGGHFGFPADEIAKVVGGVVQRVRAELGS